MYNKNLSLFSTSNVSIQRTNVKFPLYYAQVVQYIILLCLKSTRDMNFKKEFSNKSKIYIYYIRIVYTIYIYILYSSNNKVEWQTLVMIITV